MPEENRITLRKTRWEQVIYTALIIALTGLIFGLGWTFFTLPDIGELEKFQHAEASQVYDVNGRPVAKLFEENRIVVPLSEIPLHLQQAVLAIEDTRFYSHIGLDFYRILGALWVDIKTRSISEGGSTITQQLVKKMFLTDERTLTRKLKEAYLALSIERRFTKQEILEAYLNQIYLGEGAYGMEAAAQVYFRKHVSQLTLAESALLAGVINGPNIYSPYVDLSAAVNRRNVVLNRMAEVGYITPAQAEQAKKEPVKLAGRRVRAVQASYFLDYIARQLEERYGADMVYKGGLKIYTTLDLTVQGAAEKVLGQYQGAVVAIDPRNGYIKAMVGGRNYQESQFNRALLAYRQPGSAFKPFVYAAALEQGWQQNTLLTDEPVNWGIYAPQNFDKKFRGPVTMKTAVRLSLNVPAVRTLEQVGMENVIALAKNLGISTLTEDDKNLALALGGLTGGVNLMELTTAYTAFANQGIITKPVAIVRVEDANGQVLEEARPEQRAVLRAETAFLLTDMLKSVIDSGTGTAARIGRPAAGKTGTTDDYRSAWFIGYTPELVTGIYIGNDDQKPVGIAGGNVAAMWGKMMAEALANTPVSNFPVPPNVVTGVKICTSTGKPPDGDCKEVELDAFIKGTEPKPKRTPLKRLFPWWPF